MALDSRLIGIWDLVGDYFIWEISPSGKRFSQNPVMSYEILDNGTRLKITKPNGKDYYYDRFGDPATSILGEWVIQYGDEKEYFIYNADGTFVSHWDYIDYSHGYFTYTATELTSTDYRGTISTEDDKWFLQWMDTISEARYTVNEAATEHKLLDKDSGELLATYIRIS